MCLLASEISHSTGHRIGGAHIYIIYNWIVSTRGGSYIPCPIQIRIRFESTLLEAMTAVAGYDASSGLLTIMVTVKNDHPPAFWALH